MRALNGVSLRVFAGEVFCVVGESGCGKSTLAQVVAGLCRPDAGEVRFGGERIDHLSEKRRRPFRRAIQMVFQNPDASLNPRMTVEQTLTEVARFHFPALRAGAKARERAAEVLALTGLSADALGRFPHQFSGGQRQRLSIARALIARPQFVIADEPVAALDVSVQAQILNLLGDLRREQGLAFLFISHDLSVVREFGGRVAVMYLGRVCEEASCAELFAAPRHPYTRALLAAAPAVGKALPPLRSPGEPPSPTDLPGGCYFHPRCRYAEERCRGVVPGLFPPPTPPIGDGGGEEGSSGMGGTISSMGSGRTVACHAVAEGRI